MAGKMLFLLAALLLAPLVFAENIDIENNVVGKDLSGRKLMRTLMWGDDQPEGPPMQPPPGMKGPGGWPKKGKGWPWPKKYEKKTCFVTVDKVKTYTKDEYEYSTCDKTYFKKITYEQKKTYPVTSYVTSTYEKVKKIPKVHEDVETITFVKTFEKSYEKTYEYIYKKKGWNDDYWVPPQCKPPPMD